PLTSPAYDGTIRPVGAAYDMGAFETAITSNNFYYIANNGNDANSGTSTSSAWKTISKVNNSIFQPGDYILFKRGEVWREQLVVPSSGIQGNPIVFEDYGTGEKPRITTAVPLSGNSSVYDTMNPLPGVLIGEDGGFENYNIGTSWTANSVAGGSTVTRDSSTKHSGTYSGKVHRASDGTFVGISKNVTARAKDAKFKLKFYGKTAASNSLQTKISFIINGVTYYLTSSGTWTTSSTWITTNIGPNSDWTQDSITFVTPNYSGAVGPMNIAFSPSADGDINIDDVQMQSLWLAQSGQPNVYKIDIQQGNTKQSMLVNGSRSNFVTTLGDVTSFGKVYYEFLTGYNSMYYVYSETIPDQDNSNTIEIITTDNAVTFNPIPAIYANIKDNIIIRNLAASGGGELSTNYDGIMHFKDSDNLSVLNCDLKGSDGPGIYWYGNNGTFSFNVFNQVGGKGALTIWQPSDTVAISHNTFTNIGNSLLDDTLDGHSIGLQGGITGDRPIKNVVISDNEVSYSGFSGTQVHLAMGTYNNENVTIVRNYIHDNYSPNGIGILTASKNVDVSYNVIANNLSPAGAVSPYYMFGIQVNLSTGGPAALKTVEDVNIYNNTLFNNQSAVSGTDKRGGLQIYCANSSDYTLKNIYVKNNIVYNNFSAINSNGYELLNSPGVNCTLNNINFNNNLYYRDQNINNTVYSTTAYDLSHVVGGGTGFYSYDKLQDNNSLTTNPLFTSSSDSHLTNLSPAINAGTEVGLTSDFAGNPKSGANWDIGAYEFQDSTAPSTTAVS
ncbi:MAG TPA: right-handed parallel beta-helix repeat-containing protein, partial [Clostridia bacterium]|nr:right-handed parallel beta-helix repeat-containing protein [Clostridia bacterium]